MILLSRVDVPHELYACTSMLKVIKDKITHVFLNKKLTRNLKPYSPIFLHVYMYTGRLIFHFVDVNDGWYMYLFVNFCLLLCAELQYSVFFLIRLTTIWNVYFHFSFFHAFRFYCMVIMFFIVKLQLHGVHNVELVIC